MSDTTNTPAPLAPSPAPPPTAAPASTALFSGGPQERFAEMQRDNQRRDPATNPDLIMKRDDRGVVTYHEKTRDPKTGEVKAGKLVAGETGAPADGPASPKPEGDEQRYKFGDDLELSETEIRDLMAHKAADDSRKALIPESPKGYKLELPKDLKLPPGVAFEMNPNDPLKGPGLEMARNFAHAKGMSQADFSDMMGVYAAATAGEQIILSQAYNAEVAKLGPAAPARIDAVVRWFGTQEKGAALANALKIAPVASTIEAFERIMHKLQSQGAGSFSRSGGEPPNDGRLTDEQYGKLSYGERKNYAERMTVRAERGGRR